REPLLLVAVAAVGVAVVNHARGVVVLHLLVLPHLAGREVVAARDDLDQRAADTVRRRDEQLAVDDERDGAVAVNLAAERVPPEDRARRRGEAEEGNPRPADERPPPGEGGDDRRAVPRRVVAGLPGK